MKNTLRIKKDKVFKYIFKKGVYSKGNYVIVHSCKTKFSEEEKGGVNFFAVCVSKKNGNSVIRNRLKRYARAVYTQEETKLKSGYNYVIMYKKETIGKEINFNLIKEDIIKCLKELDLYEENI
ncbi:MAG: ribonuclease P protein component [Clostridia bacterium]|jgi:ribonuclease P protein component|nr:ribonuclease P protein component [Clostridia bacterium]